MRDEAAWRAILAEHRGATFVGLLQLDLNESVGRSKFLSLGGVHNVDTSAAQKWKDAGEIMELEWRRKPIIKIYDRRSDDFRRKPSHDHVASCPTVAVAEL